VVGNGHASQFFENSRNPLYEDMWDKVRINTVDTVEEGIQKVRESNGDLVFIMDSSITAEYYVNQKPCDLYMVGEAITDQGMAIITRHDLKEYDAINLAMLYMLERGEIQTIVDKWAKDEAMCGPVERQGGLRVRPMRPGGMLGPVLVFLVGGLVALVIRVIQQRKNPKKEEPINHEDNAA
jgi:hypothetical protein